MSLKEILQETAAGWISDVESRSLNNIVSSWTDDMQYTLHPDTEGVFPMGKEQWVDTFPVLYPGIRYFIYENSDRDVGTNIVLV